MGLTGWAPAEYQPWGRGRNDYVGAFSGIPAYLQPHDLRVWQSVATSYYKEKTLSATSICFLKNHLKNCLNEEERGDVTEMSKAEWR